MNQSAVCCSNVWFSCVGDRLFPDRSHHSFIIDYIALLERSVLLHHHHTTYKALYLPKVSMQKERGRSRDLQNRYY